MLLSTNSLEMHTAHLMTKTDLHPSRITESGQRRLAGFHQFPQPKIPLFYIQLSNIITRHSYQQAMAIRFDVVRTINNPSLRVDGGLLRRLPIEVDEHFIFHIESCFPLIMHSPYFRLLFGLHEMLGVHGIH